jgi:hypothetical protein
MKIVHVGIGPEIGENVDDPSMSHKGVSSAEVNERLTFIANPIMSDFAAIAYSPV